MRNATIILLGSLALSISAAAQDSAAIGKLDQAWRDLADADAVKAYQAIGILLKSPEETVRYFDAKLPPATAPDRAQVESRIEDLGSGKFVVRDKANVELGKLGCLVEPALRGALEKASSVETRQRLEKLLDTIAGPVTLPEELRQLRAVEALEHIATKEAQKLLKRYADGAAASALTREAKDALARIANAPPRVPLATEAKVDRYGDPLPKGALGRLGSIRFRRDFDGYYGDPDGFRFTLDGKTVLAAGGTRVQGWDIKTGQRTFDVQLSTEQFYSRHFAMSADGKRVAISFHIRPLGKLPASQEIRVFEFPSANLIRSFPQIADFSESSMAFSPDGKLLFSFNSRAGEARVEEIETGNELAKEKFARDIGAVIAVSPDGELVAVPTGPNSRKLFLWKWKEKAPPRELALKQYGISEVSFSPDGKLLAGIDNLGRLMVWDVDSGRMIYDQRCPERGFHYRGTVIFSPDGKLMAVPLHGNRISGAKIYLLDPPTGTLNRVLEDSSRVAFSPDSKLAAVTTGTAARLFDLSTGNELSERAECHDSAPALLSATSNDILVTSGDDGHVRIWDAATSKLRFKWRLNNWVRDIAVSPDGRLVAASSLDDLVHVWDISQGKELYRLPGHGDLGGRRTVAFAPDSSRLISFGDDYDLRGWDMKTGKALFEHKIRPDGAELPDPDDIRGGFDREMSATTLSPDGKVLLIQGFKGGFLFDSENGKQNAKLNVEGGFFRNYNALSRDGKFLLSSLLEQGGSGKQSLSYLELPSGKETRHINLPGQSPGPVAISPDGRTLATATDEPEDQIVLIEKATGKIRGAIRGFSGRIRGIAFFPDNCRLASSHADATVLIWDLGRIEPWEKGR